MPSELIACDDCGRSFTTDYAEEMLAAIKGPCPSCGGTFRRASLAGAPSGPAEPPVPGSSGGPPAAG